MNLFLVRHGQSLANAGFETGVDSSLSPLGRAEAAGCAEFLAERLEPAQTQLLSSPFRRAVQTADFIATRCELRIHLEPALHELFFAAWFPAGPQPMLALRELAELFPRIQGPAPAGAWWPATPETEATVVRRAAGMRNRLLGNEFNAPNLVCVSHAGMIAALIAAFDPALVPEELGNASVTHLCWENGTVRVLLCAERGFLKH